MNTQFNHWFNIEITQQEMDNTFSPVLLWVILSSLLLFACQKPDAIAQNKSEDDIQEQSAEQTGALCPSEIIHQGLPPQTDEIHHDLDYWIETWAESFDLDQPLLTTEEIKAHREALALEKLPVDVEGTLRSQLDLKTIPQAEVLQEQIAGRLTYLKEMIDQSSLVKWDGDQLDDDEKESFSLANQKLTEPRLYIALHEFQIRCGPYPEKLKKLDADQTIDRNACTRVKPQAPVQVLGSAPFGMRLIRSRLAIGWISSDVKLLPIENDRERQDYLGNQFVYEPTMDPQQVKLFQTKFQELGAVLSPLKGTRFPRVTPYARTEEEGPLPPSIWVATNSGLKTVALTELGLNAPKELSKQQEFTRRNVLRQFFTMLNQNYGLGGQNGGVDCSRFIVNGFEPFGLNPPRYSGHQAHMGTFGIDLSNVSSDRERLNLLDAAFKQGITLLYLPGHITVYLGHDQDDTPRLLHAFADYQKVCPNALGETKLRVNRVAVTDVYRGEGSSKGSYLSRGTRIVVLGGEPGPSLQGIAKFRVPSPILKPERVICRRTKNRARIFTSPQQANQKEPTRFMVTRPKNDSPAQLTLFGPNNQEITPELKRLGGPPYTYYTDPIMLDRGRWRAAYGEGQDLHSCTHIEVKRKPIGPEQTQAMWTPKEEWSPHTETLFSAFIERLFQYPIEEDRSWTNLQDMLNVPEQNLLFNHFSQQEDAQLKLQPDCADLPYTLRAYFAWKFRLPFSYMTCTRGSKKKAPRCMSRVDSFMPRENRSLGKDFQWFARKGIAGHVHSASARTLPDDNETELYPISLTREALRPGIVFADPYGHLLLIAGWVPQPLGGYGILIGADGQPDGTIGRRRFWEGSFLFDPDTRLVGAGFKAFRPMVKKEKSKAKAKKEKNNQEEREETAEDWRPLNNEELTTKRMGPLAWNKQQYKGTRQDFYDVMNALSSPRPIEIKAQLSALADALHESARRRVLSVDNGEGWMKNHPRKKMRMPSGYSIFETSGPWEDFATPSRDMRLLIAIDTVLDLPQALKRNPQRFGMTTQEAQEKLPQVQTDLKQALQARVFEYTKSDGSKQTLSLWDLNLRQKEMEMAYNPNDCVETRWGAPANSDEANTCQRKAPKRQLRKMKKYRSWFSERKRPPRGTR